MTNQIPGIHHVTAISSSAAKTVRFHTEVLGLRLIKRTVNFDDPSTYHLYFGDGVGTPGTIMTFFPFGEGNDGRVGRGQVAATAYVVPDGSLEFWRERFETFGIETEEQEQRFGNRIIQFTDSDGQPYELVEATSAIEPWAEGSVPAEHAIRGLYGVTIDSLAPDRTASILETMGYEQTNIEGERTRYEANGDRAVIVDIIDRPDGSQGTLGAGTVHHVAFRTANDDKQAQWQETFRNQGLRVTEQKDRQYFRSIYFREPGGVLFEIATDSPGFTRDEHRESLGSELKLPPWLADNRNAIEQQLPSLEGELLDEPEQ